MCMGSGGQAGAAKRGWQSLSSSSCSGLALTNTTQQTWAERSVPSTLAELPAGILSAQKEPRKHPGWTKALWEAGANMYLSCHDCRLESGPLTHFLRCRPLPGSHSLSLDQAPLILGDIGTTSDRQPGKGRLEASLTASTPEPR